MRTHQDLELGPLRTGAWSSPTSELDEDVRRALRAAAHDLHHDLGGDIAPGLIEDLLAERYRQLARQARITQYLPLLAERSVRDHLRGQARPSS